MTTRNALLTCASYLLALAAGYWAHVGLFESAGEPTVPLLVEPHSSEPQSPGAATTDGASMRSTIATLAASDVVQAIAFVNSRKGTSSYREAHLQLLDWLATHDPEQALAYIRGLPWCIQVEDTQLLASMLIPNSQGDFASTVVQELAFFTSPPLMGKLLAEKARKGADVANLIGGVYSSARSRTAQMTIGELTAAGDYESALRVIRQGTTGPERTRLLSTLIGQWSASAPEIAYARAAELENPVQRDVTLKSWIRSKASSDLGGAIEALNSMESPWERSQAYYTIAEKGFATQRVDAIPGYLAGISSGVDRQGVIKSFARIASEEQRATLLDAVAENGDSQLRLELAFAVLDSSGHDAGGGISTLTESARNLGISDQPVIREYLEWARAMESAP